MHIFKHTYVHKQLQRDFNSLTEAIAMTHAYVQMYESWCQIQSTIVGYR